MPTATLTLTGMAHGGDAVGRVNDQVIFVPLGLPGETVRVAIEPTSKRFAYGRILEIIEPAASRVDPPCPYFGLCGGCQWQHVDYPTQLALKRETLVDLLGRLGGQQDVRVEPMLGMETPWAYRNHVQLKGDPQGRIGYHALKSHDVVPVERCLLTDPLLDEMWEALDIEFAGLTGIGLRAGINTGEQMLVLEGAPGDEPELEVDLPISCVYLASETEITILAGNAHLSEVLLGRRYQISAPSFFQVNTTQAEKLVEIVREYLDLKPTQRLLDAYCGVGTFAHALAEHAQEVIGIESSPWAIEDAVANTERDNVGFIQDRIESGIAELDQADAVVLDPPRAGCSPDVLRALARLGAKRLAYVSCDPATLARDVKLLTSLGYALTQIQPLDLFPQTYHIECVALLRST